MNVSFSACTVKINNTGVTGQSLLPKNDFEHARGPRNSTYAVNLTYDRHTDIHTDIPTYIYHVKSRLNTPVWDSLRSPNEIHFSSVGLDCIGERVK